MQSMCQIERSYSKSKWFTKVSGMHTYLWKPPNEDRNWSLMRGAMEISALFWHLETLYWMTFQHWGSGPFHCVPDRFTFILKQVLFLFLLLFFFGSQLTLEIPAEKQLYFSFGQFFCLSPIFLWLFPMNSIYLLPPTFFFVRLELTSDFRSVAGITDNMAPHSSWDNTS